MINIFGLTSGRTLTMRRRYREIFTTIKTEGALLPVDFLQRLAAGDRDLTGISPEDYHLAKHERLGEVINRAWNRLLGAWHSFHAAAATLPPTDMGTTLTRERWLLILFQELAYGRLVVVKAPQINGKTYPISHFWQKTPIHLVSFRQDLDRRTPGIAGAARLSPYSLIQEFLNRSDDHLWGLVSNGLKLRLLRDNVSLTRQAYIEFDLEAMMNSEVYADFALLFLLLHQSRVEAEKPELCWLERWSQEARRQGIRALEQLRQGVEQAIATLGQGFLDHPANTKLRKLLQSGALTPNELYQQLLRLIYRLIFLFVAEDRDLLLQPQVAPEARQRYLDHYSLSRMRRLARRHRGTRHGDLWQGFKITCRCLEQGEPALGLAPLGGFLFAKESLAALNDCELANQALLEAVRHLSFTTDQRILRPVDYRNLGTEELGSVYESLLELHPQVNVNEQTFKLQTAAGSERKTTGSYYTPASLIQCLLNSALEPVIAPALKAPDPEKALLSLKIVDPACGSGHFLIAAAHRLGKHLATVRTGESEPAPEERRRALREVVAHCIYGVDLNPLAVELCKVALWMETLDPGRPLGFLDHRIKCGNSLLGATPALLQGGISDDAFKPIAGDDKSVCSEFKKRNKQERLGRRGLVDAAGDPWERLGDLATGMMRLGDIKDNTPDDVRRKQERYEAIIRSSGYLYGQFWADAWGAAFVWKKTKESPYPITEEVFRRLERNPHDMVPWMRDEIQRLATENRFFHWHLAFPEVFRIPEEGEESGNPQAGWRGGFDVVLGNPPWERIKLQEKEFFAQRDPEIAQAPNAAARKRLITQLRETNPPLWAEFLTAKRAAEGESHFFRHSGRYPLNALGDINTYQIFAGLARQLISPQGRAGIIVPSGIATDDTNKHFFADLTEKKSLVSLYDFENREKLFPDVDSRMKFCLLTLGGAAAAVQNADFAFFLTNPEQLREDDRHFTLSAADIALLNPNTRTCPIFRSKRDAELTKAIYRRVPVLIHESKGEAGNPWGIKFSTMFHMANDSHLFRTRAQLENEGWRLEGNIFYQGDHYYLPLYEAKLLHHFDHRWATYEGDDTRDLTTSEKSDPHMVSLPRYWVPERQVVARTAKAPRELIQAWLQEDYEKAQDIIEMWLFGHHLNDEISSPVKLQAKAQHYSVSYIKAAMNLAEKFPLEAEDLAWMEEFQEHKDSIDLSELLIRARRPRWLLGWRDITNTTNERTVISSVLPLLGVGHKFPLVLNSKTPGNIFSLIACFNSMALDYIARQKLGGTSLTYFIIKQLPIFKADIFERTCPWSLDDTFYAWLSPRVLELTYTAWDLAPFAQDLGYNGPPFRWDEDRRLLIRCELDALYFHLYGINRADADYILETFPIVKRKDVARYGEYRTKRLILECYDALQRAQETGQPYQTILDPPPADPRVAHSPRL